MWSKVLFLVCLSISLQCAKLMEEELEDKLISDAWIQDKFRKMKTNCAKLIDYPKPNTKPRAYPAWTVAIIKTEYIKGDPLPMRKCTGSLIGPGVVLTTASCLNGSDIKNIKVRAGDSVQINNTIKSYSQERRIKSITIHERHSENSPAHDIALVFLETPFEMNQYVNTGCMALPNQENSLANVKCYITGWEHQKFVQKGFDKISSIDAAVVSRYSCQEVLRRTALGEKFFVDPHNMCAMTTSNTDYLADNSGAALYCRVCTPARIVLVGIVSYGFETSSLPFILTSVGAHHSWITRQCNNQCHDIRSCT